MLTVHHLEQSRSSRILWALEELQLDYRLQTYKRQPSFAAPDELKKIHPLGKAPILQDAALCLAESGAILEYLQEQYDSEHQFKPQDQQQLTQYLFWIHFAEGSLMPLLVLQLVLKMVPKNTPFLVRPVANKIVGGIRGAFVKPRLREQVNYIEHYLAEHSYFAGEFSFADIQMAFPLQMLQQRLQADYPNIQAFLARIAQRPAYQRAMLKVPA